MSEKNAIIVAPSINIFLYFSRYKFRTLLLKIEKVAAVVVVIVVVVVVGQTVGSISSRTLAYDCLCTLELCTASMIATS